MDIHVCVGRAWGVGVDGYPEHGELETTTCLWLVFIVAFQIYVDGFHSSPLPDFCSLDSGMALLCECSGLSSDAFLAVSLPHLWCIHTADFSVLLVSLTLTSKHSLQGISRPTPVCFILWSLSFSVSTLLSVIGQKQALLPAGYRL